MGSLRSVLIVGSIPAGWMGMSPFHLNLLISSAVAAASKGFRVSVTDFRYRSLAAAFEVLKF
jgi:hypothetical protein